MKRLTLLSLIVPLALLLSSCSLHLGLGSILGSGSSGSKTPVAKTVKATHTAPANPDALSIVNAKYRPKNLTVKVGTTLTWTNEDSVPQSVTSDAPGVFDSGLLAPGATFSYTFATAGTFPYHSSADKTSFGSITVTP
jgi:plastocyanin